MSDSNRARLLYDGDCTFCKHWVARWQRLTGETVKYLPYQEVAEQYPHITREELARLIHFVDADGQTYRGAEAVFRSLAKVKYHRWWIRAYKKLPGFAWLSERLYGFVARHRRAFSILTRWFVGRETTVPNYQLATWLFLRLLAAVYLIAFVSLGTQITGLVGENGILPLQNLLKTAEASLGSRALWKLPTLLWLNPTDIALNLFCIGGTLFALLLLFNILPRVAAGATWLLYLSLTVAGDVFLSYQWDILLLEAGFLAIFLTPAKALSGFYTSQPPAKLFVWLAKWLLFRLMFSSGMVKLLSGDPTWKGLTALRYHYETQPLPNVVSWYFHHAPASFHTVSTFTVLFLELVMPFLIFAPRRLRYIGCIILLLLQLLILLTGNYCFFNLLTIALCLFLLDDGQLNRWVPHALRQKSAVSASQSCNKRWGSQAAYAAVALFLFISSSTLFWLTLNRSAQPPLSLRQLAGLGRQFYLVGNYGLFAVMTTVRNEIIVEGSHDGKNWQAYEFKWKPGDITRAPAFVAPHQPRLDWQMWFAALRSFSTAPWIQNFLYRLLKGEQEVLALLQYNPFADQPPRFIRAQLYRYDFSEFAERYSLGQWWQRRFIREYSPKLSLTKPLD